MLVNMQWPMKAGACEVPTMFSDSVDYVHIYFLVADTYAWLEVTSGEWQVFQHSWAALQNAKNEPECSSFVGANFLFPFIDVTLVFLRRLSSSTLNSSSLYFNRTVFFSLFTTIVFPCQNNAVKAFYLFVLFLVDQHQMTTVWTQKNKVSRVRLLLSLRKALKKKLFLSCWPFLFNLKVF